MRIDKMFLSVESSFACFTKDDWNFSATHCNSNLTQ